ncbi:MAG: hypothetical protein U1A78_35360 [Polyangia bacterium]
MRRSPHRPLTAPRIELNPLKKSAARLAAGLLVCAGLAGNARAQDPTAATPASTTEPTPASPSAATTDTTGSTSSGTSDTGGSMPSAAAIEEAAMGGKAKQKVRGLAVYLTIGGRYVLATPDVNTTLSNTAFQGGLFAGYKLDRIVVGLGFDISHIGTATKYAAGSSQSSGSRGDTAFLLGPGIQAAILRSKDQRIELIGAFQIGFGRTFTSISNDPAIPPQYGPENNVSNFHLAYQIGPGLRYWAHPQFALTVGSGISGDHLFFSQNNPSGNKADQVNAVSLYGTLGALGVF